MLKTALPTVKNKIRPIHSDSVLRISTTALRLRLLHLLDDRLSGKRSIATHGFQNGLLRSLDTLLRDLVQKLEVVDVVCWCHCADKLGFLQ